MKLTQDTGKRTMLFTSVVVVLARQRVPGGVQVSRLPGAKRAVPSLGYRREADRGARSASVMNRLEPGGSDRRARAPVARVGGGNWLSNPRTSRRSLDEIFHLPRDFGSESFRSRKVNTNSRAKSKG